MAISPSKSTQDLGSVPKFGEDLFATLGTPFFQMMIDNVPDLIWAKDMEDRYLFVNRAICRSVLMCDTVAEA